MSKSRLGKGTSAIAALAAIMLSAAIEASANEPISAASTEHRQLLIPSIDPVPTPVPFDWISPNVPRHILSGLMFNTGTRALGDLLHEFDCGSMVLLGEAHDNPAHHQAQATLISLTTAPDKCGTEIARQSPAIVFEQFSATEQPALDAFSDMMRVSPEQATLDAFKQRIGWAQSAWSQYDYDPLFRAAIAGRHAIVAGDVPRDEIRSAAKSGEDALPLEKRRRLKLDVPLGPKFDEASRLEIEQAHCGMLPAKSLPNMAFAQRYRDASLADALMTAAQNHGRAIGIVGTGHARRDRGVPWYIRQRAPEASVISVLLVEVEAGNVDPKTYVPLDPDGKPAADYLIFTPPVDRGDPCEGFGKP